RCAVQPGLQGASLSGTLAACIDSSTSFFFQAEDGIRDRNVTGVQTCALPISTIRNMSCARRGRRRVVSPTTAMTAHAATKDQNRSEERRVGKERRSRWAADQ